MGGGIGSTAKILVTPEVKAKGTPEEEVKGTTEEKAKSVKQIVMEMAESMQKAEIEKFRRQMNFPAEVERTSSMTIGSGRQSTDEEIDTANKRNTYNRNSKRGTRLVRVSRNG